MTGMLILGIETSCDETAVAIVERGETNRVLAEEIKSQIPLHAKYGGIVPEIASRNHYEVIDLLTRRALKKSRRGIGEIDIAALTLGPGLIGSLLVGLSFAKGLAFAYRLPLVAIDHILAHIESAFITSPGIEYPLVALVVSGGHTSLFFQPQKFQTEILAKTRDDAAGEIMDKIATYFGLGYPGGPVLDRLYPEGDPERFTFTSPKMSDGSDDFSFSGYKTAVLRYARNSEPRLADKPLQDLLSSFLGAVIDYLLKKTVSAVKRLNVKSVVVSGGVSRNSLLRKKFAAKCAEIGVRLYLPDPSFCTDNASMVAWLGYEKYLAYPNLNYFDFSLNSYSRATFREGTKHR